MIVAFHRYIMVVLLSFSLFGCGKKFVYDNLDWFLLGQLDDLITLSRSQEQSMEPALSALLSWHKQKELPEYAKQLDRLAALDLNHLTVEEYHAERQWAQRHVRRLMVRIYPDLLVFIPTLSDKQIEDLLDTIRQRHIDYKRELESLDSEQKRARFQSKVEQQFEQWFGQPTEQQQSLIVQWSRDSSFPYELWIEFQTQIRIELKQMFSQRNETQQFERALQRLLFDPEMYYAPKLAFELERNNQIQIEYVIALAHSLTPRQIDFFHEELRYWRDLIDDIR